MFTGIVEELGEVTEVSWLDQAARLTISGALVTQGCTPGDSIAVSGVCLTVVECSAESFTADVMLETLERSALRLVQAGTPVNLERAATLNTRMGGHLVQGHVDGTATVESVSVEENWTVLTFSCAASLSRYIVEKGSVCIDGVSLTVSQITDSGFEVSLIPTTLAMTTMGKRSIGDMVNVEVDVVAKYVERLLPGYAQ